jgi:hypothetical protein
VNDITKFINNLREAEDLESRVASCLGMTISVLLCPDIAVKALLRDKLQKAIELSNLDIETEKLSIKIIKLEGFDLIRYIESLDMDKDLKNMFIRDIRGVCGIGSH